MIEVFLAWGSAGVSDFFNKLQDLGFFQYVLPFLLIFALVYAILSKIDLFEKNKGASVLIAFATGLLALQLNFVPAFFQDVFPKFGIGLSLLLIALVLAGAFLLGDEKGKKVYPWIFFGLGALMFLIISISSLSSWQFMGSDWFNQYGALAIVVIVVVGAIVGVVVASKKE